MLFLKKVYGEVPADSDHATESETVLTPTNPYAATKAAAGISLIFSNLKTKSFDQLLFSMLFVEFLVLAYYKSFGLPVIVTRGNNVYGSHQFPEKLIPKVYFVCLRKKKCLSKTK